MLLESYFFHSIVDILNEKGGKNENDPVAHPKSIPTHLNAYYILQVQTDTVSDQDMSDLIFYLIYCSTL